ncbi:MAG: hypothetical protein EXQ85_04355 [Alphaproteobacteria bacterium]|nr:hypothetical protein [Alphaproteobacteria bacterium]
MADGSWFRRPWGGKGVPVSAQLLRHALVGLVLSIPPWLAAGPSRAQVRLARTPEQTAGPFYPAAKPAERDADLVHFAGGTARGDRLRLAGRVLDRDGRPLTGATVEIWQADHQGIYRHPNKPRRQAVDAAFQGWGGVVTDAGGRYEFQTIVPVPYTRRAPHIHARILASDRRELITQLYLKGHPDNARDSGGARGRDQLLIDPVAAGPERRAIFDFVL